MALQVTGPRLYSMLFAESNICCSGVIAGSNWAGCQQMAVLCPLTHSLTLLLISLDYSLGIKHFPTVNSID